MHILVKTPNQQIKIQNKIPSVQFFPGGTTLVDVPLFAYSLLWPASFKFIITNKKYDFLTWLYT